MLVAEFIYDLFPEGDSVTYAGYLIPDLKRYVPRCRFELHTAAVYFRKGEKITSFSVQPLYQLMSCKPWLLRQRLLVIGI